MNPAVFKSYDIRGKVGTELTPQFARDVARAHADYLTQPGAVVVGYDMRPDSAELAAAYTEGLQMQGRDVIDVGQVPSDMVYFAVGKYSLAGGTVITASHNPGADNGIKLYAENVTPIGLASGLSEIRDNVMHGNFKDQAATPGTVTQRDITQDWVDHCLTFIHGLQPFHIAIDAGNGMAGAILPSILPRLAVKAEEMYFELDGSFPNHEANPMKHETLKDLATRVRENNLDFGVAFDGDGDRCGFVDDKGRPVAGSDLLSIVAQYMLKKYPGAKVIHEVRTSRGTQELIRKWGGEPICVKAGRVFVGAKMREVGSPFGGETTGHFFFKDNFDADSGLITALVTMQAITDARRKLSDMVDDVHLYASMEEMNFNVDDPQSALLELKKTFTDGEQSEIDGITVNYPDMWFNVRASNTEPLIRMNAEARTKAQLDELVERVKKVIQG